MLVLQVNTKLLQVDIVVKVLTSKHKGYMVNHYVSRLTDKHLVCLYE